ncbi:H-type lectin domain-containing protein [Pseudogemmobacter humi]|uniref:H-type lectin domain protein n=1 Tax=Pseudogemmobacter humi TaxID=2483812 RepID=A0A3P5WW74_9RHOB|nr:H-type lectin domain-containing protein [Pseudogemmobacter humi]VDC26045.1 H-type lectin domain protein [Pseudogemmobacter humi]
MRRFHSPIGILQGSRVLFSDFADGGQMWTGQGNRESRFIVNFREKFIAPPAVMVGLSMWDMDSQTNSRADITAEAVTVKGFHIVFRTWGDSRVARVRADWTAIGPLRDEDDWDVG